MNKGEEKGEDSVCLRNAVDQFGSSVRFLRWNNGRLGEKMGQFNNNDDNNVNC